MNLAAVTVAPGDVRLSELDDGGTAGSGVGDAVVAVEAVGLCGTDLHIYDGSFPGARYPVVQGHEFAGRIVALPDGYAGDLRLGRRVAVEPIIPCGACYPCRAGRPNGCTALRAIGVQVPGGLQQAVAVPASLCHAVDDLEPAVAALCEPVSVGLHAVNRADVAAGEQVLVVGAGPIGLAFLIAAVDRGAEVMSVDLQPGRLRLAGELGAAVTVTASQDPGALAAQVRDWTGGQGPAVVAEATGVAAVAEQALELVASTGRVVLLGVSAQRISVPLRIFTAKELTVLGTRGTPRFDQAVELVRRQSARVARLVSHEFPLERAPEAFRFAVEHPDEAVKVIVRVAGGDG